MRGRREGRRRKEIRKENKFVYFAVVTNRNYQILLHRNEEKSFSVASTCREHILRKRDSLNGCTRFRSCFVSRNASSSALGSGSHKAKKKAALALPTHLFMGFVRILAVILVRWLASGRIGGFRLRRVSVRLVLREKEIVRSKTRPESSIGVSCTHLLIIHRAEKVVAVQTNSLWLWAGR